MATTAEGGEFSLACSSTVPKKAKSDKVLDVAEQMCMAHSNAWALHRLVREPSLGRRPNGGGPGLSRKKLNAMVMRIMKHLKAESTATGLYTNFNRVLVAIRRVVNQNLDGVAVTLNDGFDAGMKELNTIKGIKSGMAADMGTVFFFFGCVY